LAADLPAILKAIRKADLDAEGAMSIVAALRERELIDFGIAKSGPGREKFIHFLTRFWDLEKSPYLKDKIAHGHRITQKYCREAGQKIKKHWLPYFGDTISINGITRAELREFSIILHDKGFSSSTINNIMIVGTAALKWAHTEGIIPSDPSDGLTTFTGEEIRRSILTEEEIETLFQVEWLDRRAYIAALVSLTTGIRSGEIRALRQDSIQEDILDISWNWNELEGLKCPKNGEPRGAPLLPEIQRLLLGLIDDNPYKDYQESSNPFIFYSEKQDRPCSAELFRRNFIRAIKATKNSPPGWHKEVPTGDALLWMIKGEKKADGELQGSWSEPEAVKSIREYIPDSVSKEGSHIEYLYKRAEEKPESPTGININGRKIDFHSFRHIYASRMAGRIAADKVAKVTGHRSKEAAKIYQDHVTAGILKEAGAAAAKEFGNLLQFVKQGA
jgi:integrase